MVKRSAPAIVLALLVLLASGSMCAQGSDAATTLTEQPCFTSKIGSRDAKWFRHELGIISICIPETLARRKTDRCGASCYIFENEEMYFDADLSVSAWRPTFEKRYASYSGASKPLDGKQSSIWFFEDTGKYKYVAGANVILERGQIGMGVYLFSKTTDPRPIAERMFNSIKFTKTETN